MDAFAVGHRRIQVPSPPRLLRKILAHAIVVESEIDVVRQENLITRMERDGKDTIEAKTLLVTMGTKLTLQRQARRRILDLLDR